MNETIPNVEEWDWKQKFDDVFVVKKPGEFGIVAFEDEEGLTFWNAYKIRDFISILLQQQKEESFLEGQTTTYDSTLAYEAGRQKEREELLREMDTAFEKYADTHIENKDFNRMWFKAHTHLALEDLKRIISK